MLTKIKVYVYACFTVKICKNKPQRFLKPWAHAKVCFTVKICKNKPQRFLKPEAHDGAPVLHPPMTYVIDSGKRVHG